jgi:small-conductance mechanosensitive channel
VKTPVTVAYGSDVTRAMELFLAAGTAQARVLADPEPVVLLTALGDNGIVLELITWIQDAEQGQAPLRSAILVEASRLFQEHGIEIPFPRRDVRIIAGDLPGENQKAPPST